MSLMEEDDESESPGLLCAVISFSRRVSPDRHAGRRDRDREREKARERLSNAYLPGMPKRLTSAGFASSFKLGPVHANRYDRQTKRISRLPPVRRRETLVS